MTLRRRRVEAVLEHVEVEPAEIDAAEVVHLLVDQVELVVAVGGDDLLLQLLGAPQRPAIERDQLVEAAPGPAPDRSRRDCRAGSARYCGCAGTTRRRASGSRPTRSSRSRSRSPATHRRSTSAPSVLMTFCGRMTLPSDFDILRPFSSTVNPCVSTARTARGRAARPTSAASCETSRDADRSLPGTGPPGIVTSDQCFDTQ